MYVITNEVNEYDQYGEYFVAAFNRKPTLDDLRLTFKDKENSESFFNHLLNGGGRVGYEHDWYNLREVKEGNYFK